MDLKQAIHRRFVGQFQRPHGVLGRLVGQVLARRPSNVQRNLWTVELLEIEPTDRVLELGYGPGVAIEACAARATSGHVVGVDHSDTMRGVAARRNAGAMAEGRVELHTGSFETLPEFEPPFDKIFAVNAVMFAHDADALLRDLHARLRPGGRIAVTYQSRMPGATSEDSKRGGREIAERVTKAGFRSPRIELLPLEPLAAVCVLAES